jgi:hypothetical protein
VSAWMKEACSEAFALFTKVPYRTIPFGELASELRDGWDLRTEGLVSCLCAMDASGSENRNCPALEGAGMDLRSDSQEWRFIMSTRFRKAICEIGNYRVAS